jgi:hypothetical protein
MIDIDRHLVGLLIIAFCQLSEDPYQRIVQIKKFFRSQIMTRITNPYVDSLIRSYFKTTDFRASLTAANSFSI